MKGGRETVVAKFGGSTFPQEGLCEGLYAARDHLIRLSEEYQPIGVVSAPQGMSDLVIQARQFINDRRYAPSNPIVNAAAELAGGDRGNFANAVAKGIMEGYAAEMSAMGPSSGPLLDDLEMEVERLRASLAARGSDEHVEMALPENHSGKLLSGMLRIAGLESRYLDGMEAGVNADTNGTVLMYESAFRIKNALKDHVGPGKIPIVGGYIGRCRDNGKPIILGRNTTDVTGAAVSFASGAIGYQIIKDVPGVYRIEPVIRVGDDIIRIETDFLGRMSYGEAIQVAWRGSKVVHPDAVHISSEGKIPIRIKCIGPGERIGTLISDISDTTDNNPVAAMSTGNFHLLSVEDSAMLSRVKYAYNIMNILDSCDLWFFDFAKSPSEITFAIPTTHDGSNIDIEHARRVLEGSLKDRKYNPQKVYVNDAFGISLTGEKMRGTPGVTAKIAGIFGREGVSIRMGTQSDETGGAPVINYYVNPADARRILEALHTELFC